MLSAISAESLKLRRHRATWLLVWIFPIGVFVITTVALLAELANAGSQAPFAPELERWVRNVAGFWSATTGGLVRILVCAFVAVVFAGEYGWNTWKLIVPHRSRASLIAAKYVVSIGLIYAAFIAAALIYMGMTWLEDIVTGDPIPQGVTACALAQAHLQGFLASIPAIVTSIAFASLASILSRSTAAALVISVVVITLEQLFLAFGPVLSLYMPGVVELLYQALPGYHIANLGEWVIDGAAREVAFPSGEVFAYGWAVSAAIVAAWVAALVGLTFFFFRRQDIN